MIWLMIFVHIDGGKLKDIAAIQKKENLFSLSYSKRSDMVSFSIVSYLPSKHRTLFQRPSGVHNVQTKESLELTG